MKASTSALAVKLTVVIWSSPLLCTLCSRLGRGYPDISAQAIDYEIIVNGEVLYANGTTCAVSVCFPYSLLLLLYVVHVPSPR